MDSRELIRRFRVVLAEAASLRASGKPSPLLASEERAKVLE
jgi:hypothetical protein